MKTITYFCFGTIFIFSALKCMQNFSAGYNNTALAWCVATLNAAAFLLAFTQINITNKK